MANNCLVTKLKGVVDNEELEVLNYLKIWFYGSEIPNTGLYRTGNDLDPINFYDSSGNLIQSVAPYDGWLRYQDVNSNVRELDRGYFMVKKYHIAIGNFQHFHDTGLSLDDFKYSSEMEGLSICNVCGGDLSSIAHCNVNIDNQTYPGRKKDFTGNIEVFKNTSFSEAFVLLPAILVTGNIEEIAVCCKNTTNFTLAEAPSVTGTLEGFSSKLAAVRNSGILYFNVSGCSVTYGGRIIKSARLTFTESGCTIGNVVYL